MLACAHHPGHRWFIIDLLSILPFELFALASSTSADAAFVEILKLPRMLRLARFRKRMDQKSGANLFRMLWLCVLFIFLAHLVACTWWGIGRAGLPGVDFGVDAHSRSWILRLEERDATQLLAPTSGGRLLWHTGAAQAMIPHQYLASLYWALTALLKTPSIGPDTPLEKVLATIVTSRRTAALSHRPTPGLPRSVLAFPGSC